MLSLVQYMQIAQYVRIISIESPQLFNMIYAKADMMSNLNLNFTFIKNPFQKFAKCSAVSRRVSGYIGDPSFMYNTGNQIFVWAVLAIAFGASVLMKKVLPAKCVKIRAFFEGLYDSFFYSLPVETFNDIFMTVAYFAYLNLFQVSR